jgi:hypothetical protein
VHRLDVPGLAFACGLGDRVLLHEVGGVTALGPDPSAITEDTLFDLASLTKVVATTSAILALTDAGRLSLDEPLAVFEPDFRQGSKSKVTVRDLLRHTAGLPASRRYYLTCTTADEMRRRLRAEPLVADPGTTVLYSDLGFMMWPATSWSSRHSPWMRRAFARGTIRAPRACRSPRPSRTPTADGRSGWCTTAMRGAWVESPGMLVCSLHCRI